MTKERDDAVFWGVIGTIILVSALTWLGTEAGLWAFEFPFWPAMFVWVGFAIVISSIRKLRNPEENQNAQGKAWC